MKKMEKEERTDLVEEIVEAEERTVEQQQQQQPEAEATAEEHAAARTIQATFRRRVASRRMGTIRKMVMCSDRQNSSRGDAGLFYLFLRNSRKFLCPTLKIEVSIILR